MPVFGNYDWPPFLNQLIDCGDSPAQRDILLLGAVTVLGATLNKHLRILYGRKYHYPCLQTFIVAPPASGKGALTWVRHLAEPIHEAMMEEFKSLRKEYRLEKARWGSLGKERAKTPEPEEPRPKMFLIAGDNSGTGVLENLIEADGVGLICETEADTVSTAIGTDYGHWSDTLRNAFDHAGLSFNRRTDNEYRECDSTFLSMVLSGTPGQVAPLIPSGENGLFSREVFYYKSQIREWIDQFSVDEVDAEKEFHRMGYEWKATIDQLKCRGTITLRLDERQQAAYFRRRLSRRKPVRGHKRGTVRKRYPSRQYRPCRPCKAASRECGRLSLLELVRLQFPRGVVRLFRKLVLQSGGRKRAALFRLSIAGRPVVSIAGTMGREGL